MSFEICDKAIDLLKKSFEKGGKVCICGNGGSASDSEHIVGELMKSFRRARLLSQDDSLAFVSMFGGEGKELSSKLQRGLPAISLVSQTSLMTAICNDTDPSLIFAQQLFVLGEARDVLWAISTSGNSANVLKAAQVAKVRGMKVIAFTGDTGGKLKDIADVVVCSPAIETAKIQEFHISYYHYICAKLEDLFFERS